VLVGGTDPVLDDDDDEAESVTDEEDVKPLDIAVWLAEIEPGILLGGTAYVLGYPTTAASGAPLVEAGGGGP
jgi:hypothetical protein